jgi:hypothetical protein
MDPKLLLVHYVDVHVAHTRIRLFVSFITVLKARAAYQSLLSKY